VAVTASAGDVERDRCFTAGCDGFLAKPFRRAELIEAARAAALRGRTGMQVPAARGVVPMA
jgi:CheY-like chemotaxis protein